MVLGQKDQLPCKILPITIISKLVAFTQMKLAVNKAKPIYTTFSKLSESGPKTKGPNQVLEDHCDEQLIINNICSTN
jgi:hypothetical protein